MACYNPQLAEQRRQKREDLLAATRTELEALAARVARRADPPETAAAIGVRAGKIINRYKIAKHFTLTIRDGHLGYARKQDAITNEELLDGIYVIRTSEPAERLTAADGVRSYKRLALVEQAFRCLKGIDLLVRPIHHRTADRVRAHILLCLLAYYVEWHLRQAWESLLFVDEELTVDRRGATRWRRLKPRSRRVSRRRRIRRRATCRSRVFENVAGSSGDALPEHVRGDRRSQPDDVPPSDGGRCAAGRGTAVDHGVARNGNRESP